MSPKIILRRSAIAVLCLVSIFVWAWRFYPSAQTIISPTNLILKAPAFISVAKGADDAVASTISDEAGISAYFQTPSAIDLSSVRSKFRTVERETADYIIGSVPIADYSNDYDVHVYVHKDGWVLAYYLKQDPASKIINWRTYDANGATILTPKLEDAITIIVNAAGTTLTTATYYDFRYPNATHLMLIADGKVSTGKANESFQVTMPESFTVFERSWSITGNQDQKYNLDTVLIKEWDTGRCDGVWKYAEGVLNVSQLLPGQLHTIEIEGTGCLASNVRVYGGIALVYKEQ